MKQKNLVQKLVFTLLGAISTLVVLVVFSILGFIFYEGLKKISWDFLSTPPSNGMMDGGILPAIIGTFALIFGSCLFAFPIGVVSGIFMNEYAGNHFLKKFVSMMTNNLAGIPSIVFGLFGMALFVNFLGLGVSLISGCLTLGLLILPTIIRSTEESLKMVDDTYRLSSYALGANKIQTIFKVVLPTAFPNILTGLILSIGRVAGETAPIIFTAVAFYMPDMNLNIHSPVMALPYHLFVMATSGIDLEKSNAIAYGTALVLMAIILTLNLITGSVKKALSIQKN
jgi:phosphate transport system permease protein